MLGHENQDLYKAWSTPHLRHVTVVERSLPTINKVTAKFILLENANSLALGREGGGERGWKSGGRRKERYTHVRIHEKLLP